MGMAEQATRGSSRFLRLGTAFVCHRDQSRCDGPEAPSENTLRTSNPPEPSDASRNPRKMDDLDALGPIHARCIGLTALWTAKTF
jgi:hypothetical protein